MKERMDENKVEISGSVIKIWRRDHHIFARLATRTGNKESRPPFHGKVRGWMFQRRGHHPDGRGCPAHPGLDHR